MRKSNFCILLFGLLTICYGCKEHLFEEGERVYLAYCSNCHMNDGSGLGSLIPPLAAADYLGLNKELLPCIIANGQQGPIVVNGVTYNREMPGVELSDIQMLNLINYVTNSWENDLGYTTIDQVQQWKSKCAE